MHTKVLLWTYINLILKLASITIMGKSHRESALTKSILSALNRDPDRFKKTTLGKFLAFFSVRRIKLVRHEKEIFTKLRQDVWELGSDEYQGSFHTTRGQSPLKPMGDLGYSGSVSIPFNPCDKRFLNYH